MCKYRTCKNYLKIEEKINSKSGENTFNMTLGTERDLKCQGYICHMFFPNFKKELGTSTTNSMVSECIDNQICIKYLSLLRHLLLEFTK